VRRWALALVLAVAVGACSGGDDASDDPKPGGDTILAKVRTEPPGVIDARDTKCSFDGERQYTASGVVENAGDTAHHVSISVRFVDAEGVRVELASDSVSDLEPGEAARWSTQIYNDDDVTVTTCEVSTQAS
jgi:hypothetical protein